MKLRIKPLVLILAALPAAAMAIGGPSGPKLDYKMQGRLGQIVMNPYKIAPLTAIIRDGGYDLSKATVTIEPKTNGRTIEYDVSRQELLTHGGIPVWGLYPNHLNKIHVKYTRTYKGKTETLEDTVQVYAPPVYFESAGAPDETVMPFGVDVKKVDPEFQDRLYLVNNFTDKTGNGSHAVWNNPAGGALEWNYEPRNAIIDTAGDVRWYLLTNSIFDVDSIWNGGVMQGFQQNADGLLTWGYGQRYVKYDLMGREAFSRRLPLRYADFSHSLDAAENGHLFLRVSASDYKRADGKNVHTIRDVIAEIDEKSGRVVDEWRLPDILDPYRDNVLKALDQGAVCLNIDASKAGQTLSSEELAELDKSDRFGDIVGTGAGRNWAHVNSVDYDPEDDSIIISSRHQSAIIKIGRDKQVKWILGSPEGWRSPWKEKLLKPVDADGSPIKCEGSVCEGGFDWTWAQHAGYKIDEKSKGDVIYISAFDNGDARGMEQPALPSMKYSRAVIYKIDQKKMTVQQVWEYGKERGHDWYSPVTSIVKYQPDHDSLCIYSATAGASFDLASGAFTSMPNPYIEEIKWGSKTPSVEIQLKNCMGYQAFPISLKKAFD